MRNSYWLLKTEPEEWSWKQQVKLENKGAEWSGVRNFQAAKNLRNMKVGDKCFFYHTGKEKKIIGIVKIVKEFFNDKSDRSGKFVSVLVKAQRKLKSAVSLQDIKKHVFFKEFRLLKQSRLSVIKIHTKYWKKIYKMSNIE